MRTPSRPPEPVELPTTGLPAWAAAKLVRTEQARIGLPADVRFASISSMEEVITTDTDGVSCHPFETELCLPKRPTLRHTLDHLGISEAEEVTARIQRASIAGMARFKASVAHMMMAAYRKYYRNLTHACWALVIATIIDGLSKDTLCAAIRAGQKYDELYNMIASEFLIKREALRISLYRGRKANRALGVLVRHVHIANLAANVLAHCITISYAATIVFWESDVRHHDNTCIACCQRIANVACAPCGHMAMCFTCSSKTAGLYRSTHPEMRSLFRCPLCMANVVRTEPQVY